MLRASIGSLFRSPARRSPIRALRPATEGLSSVTRLSQARPGARASCLLLLGASGCGPDEPLNSVFPRRAQPQALAPGAWVALLRAELEETQGAGTPG